MATTNIIQMIDIRAPDAVEIAFSADGKTMWINVDGICRLRVVGAGRVDFDGLPLTRKEPANG